MFYITGCIRIAFVSVMNKNVECNLCTNLYLKNQPIRNYV